MEKPLLSKSTFMRSAQCLKSLYLHKNQIYLKDKVSPEQQALFQRGGQVGKLARELFPGGVLIHSNFKDNNFLVTETERQIKSGAKIIYEATFEFNRVRSSIDILVEIDGKWNAFEVKSSAKITPTYILDAALQYWVITHAGLPLKDISIINMNTDYVRQGKIDVQQLFLKTSIKTDVIKKQEYVQQKVDEALSALSKTVAPAISIGEQCFSPYKCDFRSFCWKDVPRDSVFEITGLSKAEQFELYHKGIVKIDQVPKDVLQMRPAVQVQASKDNKPKLEIGSLKKFLSDLSFPLYFTDFETVMPAIPEYQNTKPFQALPFQFSLHKLKDKSDAVEHFSFLAYPGIDERRSFATDFLKHTEGEGSILAFNASFERGVLNSLIKNFPELEEQLRNRISRIIDISIVFEKKWFYLPNMKGSNSIKNILPAVAPELTYKEMSIAHGGVAMSAFESLKGETDIFKIEETRQALLEYCKMDTFAMVKIYEVLEKAVA